MTMNQRSRSLQLRATYHFQQGVHLDIVATTLCDEQLLSHSPITYDETT
jgi:hypothetical protein